MNQRPPHPPAEPFDGGWADPEAVPARLRPHKGRGAVTRPGIRFDRLQAEPIDDGWASAFSEAEEQAAPGPQTRLHTDTSREVLTHNNSPDIGFSASVNPYRGCEHGCIYCFARPTHAYLGHSPGIDFETDLYWKPDAVAQLRRAFARKSFRPMPTMLGINTDAYQPLERRLRLTRALLEEFARHRHPVSILTKSALVVRDIDLLAPMAAEGLVRVDLSITSLDPELARTLEPRAASPRRRLGALEALTKAGIPCGVMVAPAIPGLNDHEIEPVLEAAAAAGARRAGTILLRLPLELKGVFEAWLRTHRPERAERVLSLLRQCHDGQLYRSQFGLRRRGSGPVADAIFQRFALACRRLGLNQERFALDYGRFRLPEDDPARPGAQLSLFG